MKDVSDKIVRIARRTGLQFVTNHARTPGSDRAHARVGPRQVAEILK
jgi:hypothetical protein